MIAVKRLGHVTFETPDIEKQVDHYTKVVGLTVAAREKDRVILATHLGEEAMILERGSRERAVAVAFQVDAAFDMPHGRRQLQDQGIASETRTNSSMGVRNATVFEDPNGTRIELFADSNLLPSSEKTAISPIKIGHIAFVVKDARQMVDFYTSMLGFRVSDWVGDFFAFLRCGPDHHTINFLTGEEQRLHHFAFELKDWAHVQNACDHLGQKDVRIIWGPGRHGIGHNIFVYHFDPDRRVVEFYTELDQMKNEAGGYFEPRPWHKDRPQRPKVWTDFEAARLTWGPPPTPDYPAKKKTP